MSVIFFYLSVLVILFTLSYLIDCLYRRETNDIIGFVMGVMFCLGLIHMFRTFFPFIKIAQVNPVIYQIPLGIISIVLICLFWWFVLTSKYGLPFIFDNLFDFED